MLDRQFLVKTHLIMAAITLPLIMMFLITGGLYTAEYEPDSSSVEYRVTLSEPLEDNYVTLHRVAKEELKKLDVDQPVGKAKLKFDRKWNRYTLVWPGKNHSVTLRSSTRDSTVAVFTVKTPSWYARLMRLHKAKGGDIFDVYAIITTILLCLILVTGILIGLKTKLYRTLTIRALSFGSILFLSLVVWAQF